MGTKGHKEKELWKLPLYFSGSEQFGYQVKWFGMDTMSCWASFL